MLERFGELLGSVRRKKRLAILCSMLGLELAALGIYAFSGRARAAYWIGVLRWSRYEYSDEVRARLIQEGGAAVPVLLDRIRACERIRAANPNEQVHEMFFLGVLANIDHPLAIQALGTVIDECGSPVREEALGRLAISARFREHSGTAATLCNIMLHDRDAYMRAQAVLALRNFEEMDEETRSALRQAAIGDDHTLVREYAQNVLAGLVRGTASDFPERQ